MSQIFFCFNKIHTYRLILRFFHLFSLHNVPYDSKEVPYQEKKTFYNSSDITSSAILLYENLQIVL